MESHLGRCASQVHALEAVGSVELELKNLHVISDWLWLLHAFVLILKQMLKRFVVYLLVNDNFDPKYLIIAKMLLFSLKMRVEKYNIRKEKGKKHTIIPNF